MMAFSSLQKQRVGANTPLGFGLGVVFIIPTFYLSFIGFISRAHGLPFPLYLGKRPVAGLLLLSGF